MPTPPLTEEQKREALEAFEREGSVSGAARSIDMHPETFRHRLKLAREDPAISEAKAAIGTNMTPTLVWAKTKNEDGTSHSVLLKPAALQDDTLDRIRDAFERIKPAKATIAPHSHVMLTVAMAQRYREEPRATVEQTPRDLFMKQWGNSAIFAHHGDKAKPERMALYLSDICPFWSATRHRHMLTGHVHHDQAKDIGPLRWESLRAFCPPDAYAASMGYGARRAMQAITFHNQDGLVLRAIDPIERAA